MGKIRVAFPHVGNYYVPAKFLFSNILDVEVVDAPFITNKTLELGEKQSPTNVCMPFKYTLGTLLEVADKADVLLQLGGGCKYGYYGELQEKIIHDLGYDIRFYNIVTAGRIDFFRVYKYMKEIDPKFKIYKGAYYFFLTYKMIKYMDSIDHYIRANVGFEVWSGEFLSINNKMLQEFSCVKSYRELRRIYKKYFKLIRSVRLNKPEKIVKIGVIGELYTVMEPFSNYYLEKELARFNMSITRYTNASYLLFSKGKYVRNNIKRVDKYVKYKMGADATDNVIRTYDMCKNGYDGIIHIKSAFCTPEIGGMGIINKICRENDVPILFFSFDSSSSSVGIKTRLEAFNDMIEMRNG